MGWFLNLARARSFFAACGAALILSAGASRAQTPQGHGLAGFWQSYFDDGKPSGWFYFTDKNGVVEGRLVKMYKKAGETRTFELCTKCTGVRKGAPMLGLLMVWGMKRTDENKYEEGNILDPRDGSVYSAELQVSPDGQKLFVRGYLGFSLLGQTKTWTRLPDNSLPAGAIPGIASAQPARKALAPGRAMAAPAKVHRTSSLKTPSAPLKAPSAQAPGAPGSVGAPGDAVNFSFQA